MSRAPSASTPPSTSAVLALANTCANTAAILSLSAAVVARGVASLAGVAAARPLAPPATARTMMTRTMTALFFMPTTVPPSSMALALTSLSTICCWAASRARSRSVTRCRASAPPTWPAPRRRLRMRPQRRRRRGSRPRSFAPTKSNSSTFGSPRSRALRRPCQRRPCSLPLLRLPPRLLVPIRSSSSTFGLPRSRAFRRPRQRRPCSLPLLRPLLRLLPRLLLRPLRHRLRRICVRWRRPRRRLLRRIRRCVALLLPSRPPRRSRWFGPRRRRCRWALKRTPAVRLGAARVTSSTRCAAGSGSGHSTHRWACQSAPPRRLLLPPLLPPRSSALLRSRSRPRLRRARARCLPSWRGRAPSASRSRRRCGARRMTWASCGLRLLHRRPR
jgi:hypothetical protein